MNGIRTESHRPYDSFVNNIDGARCCHPTDHPSSQETVTMKMLLFHSTTKVGVNARRMVIT